MAHNSESLFHRRHPSAYQATDQFPSVSSCCKDLMAVLAGRQNVKGLCHLNDLYFEALDKETMHGEFWMTKKQCDLLGKISRTYIKPSGNLTKDTFIQQARAKVAEVINSWLGHKRRAREALKQSPKKSRRSQSPDHHQLSCTHKSRRQEEASRVPFPSMSFWENANPKAIRHVKVLHYQEKLVDPTLHAPAGIKVVDPKEITGRSTLIAQGLEPVIKDAGLDEIDSQQDAQDIQLIPEVKKISSIEKETQTEATIAVEKVSRTNPTKKHDNRSGNILAINLESNFLISEVRSIAQTDMMDEHSIEAEMEHHFESSITEKSK